MRKRIISIIFMLALVIPLIIIGGIPFSVGVLAVGVLSLKEMIDIRGNKTSIPFIVQFMAYMVITVFILTNNNSIVFEYLLDYRYIAILLFSMLIPVVIFHDEKKYNINDAMFMIGTVFFLGSAFNLLILTRQFDVLYFVFLVLITTITDTFALITGKYLGKTKLIPTISPNKTWEGVVGGTFFGVLIPCIFYYQVINSNIDVIVLVIIVTLLSLLGQVSDLLFSAIKRHYKKKDFSGLIPGHGGILDRLDSLLFVLLGFILIMNFL